MSETNARPAKKQIGPEITDIRGVSQELRDTAIARAAPKNHKGEILRDENGNQILPQIKSAREGGSYVGKVVLNSDKHLIQAVGRDQNYLIVHEKKNLQMQGEALPKLDAEKRMNGFHVQIHYAGTEAKMYPYSPEKAAERRQQAAAEKTAQSKEPVLNKDAFTKQVQEYAQTIKNAKSRESFLRHMETLGAQTFQQPQRETRQAQPAKEQAPAEHAR